jgi:hypothetical protein
MLQKEIDELKEQLGMAYPGQERYWDRGRGGSLVFGCRWLQWVVGQALMGKVT